MEFLVDEDAPPNRIFLIADPERWNLMKQLAARGDWGQVEYHAKCMAEQKKAVVAKMEGE